MYTVELDYSTATYHDDPVRDANQWLNQLGAVNVQVTVVDLHGPGGGNPVLMFRGEFEQIVKLLSAYYDGQHLEFKDAVDALLKN